MFHQASKARTNIIYACGGYGSTRGEEGFWRTAGTLHFLEQPQYCADNGAS
jgi:hypothetical protein